MKAKPRVSEVGRCKMKRVELIKPQEFGFTPEVVQDLLREYDKALVKYWKKCEKRMVKEFGDEEKGYARKNILRERTCLKGEKGQELLLREYVEIRDAIKERRLIVRWIGGLYWKVELIKDNTVKPISSIVAQSLCSYRMDFDRGAFCMSVYGTSRPLEIILNFGYSLGLKYEEIPQRQVVLD